MLESEDGNSFRANSWEMKYSESESGVTGKSKTACARNKRNIGVYGDLVPLIYIS